MEKQRKIIGICGWIGTGKDTIADYLINFYGFRRDSFASTLKDAVSAIFGWDRELVEGRTRDSREWREQVDQWWAERLNIPHLTPRWILQNWGTEVFRQGFHKDIWIASLENKLRTRKNDTVISDCRFPNEIAAIKSQGGKVIWVQRGPLPEWYDCAVLTNSTPEDEQWIISDNEQDMEHRYPKVHPSEWCWVGTEFDAIINNNGSIEELYAQIENLITSQELDGPVSKVDVAYEVAVGNWHKLI